MTVGESAKRERDFLFNDQVTYACTPVGTSCILIKPHAVASGQAGNIINSIIEAGFALCGLGQFTLNRADAEKLLAYDRSVLPDLELMAAQMAAGPAIVVEVLLNSSVPVLQSLVGHTDPALAWHIDPRSLR